MIPLKAVSGQSETKKNRIILYLVMSIVLALFAVLICREGGFNAWTTSISLLVLAAVLLQYIVLRGYVRTMSIAFFFLVLAYLFHFGLLFVMGIFPFYELSNPNIIFFYEMDLNTLRQAATFCYLCMLAFGAGLLLFARPYEKRKRIVRYTKKSYYMGFILTVLGTPFVIISTISVLKNFIEGGYLNTFDELGSGAGLISFMTNFFYAGVVLLICYYATRKKAVCYALLALTGIVILVGMFTGGRGTKLIILLLLFYIAYHCRLFKITLSKIALLVILAYLGAAFLNTLAAYRGSGQNFLTIFGTKLSNNPLFDLLAEFGGSIYTPYLCFDRLGKTYELTYGVTYLSGFITLLPNLNGAFTDIILQSNFVRFLEGITPGGSFLGEAYFNFGQAGIAVIFLAGLLIGRVSARYERAIYNDKYFYLALFTPIVLTLLWWPRDTFAGVYRLLVWGAIIIKMTDMFIKDFLVYRKGGTPCRLR